MSDASTFPLLSLQPVLSPAHAWAALLLESHLPCEDAGLCRLLREFGLAEVLPEMPCVVDADPARIDPASAADLPRDRLILRFPVTSAVDPALVNTLAALREAGFGLMATGFPASGAPLSPAVGALAAPCDGAGMSAAAAEWLFRLPGPHLALGVAATGCPGYCKFHWLAGHQGVFTRKDGKSDPTARGLLLRLLALVTRDAETTEIEALIKQDANLAYKLLKLVNSVAFMPGRHIENFSQALVLLGRRQLQRWLMLLLFARPSGTAVASPLLPQATLRANLLEALARRLALPRDSCDSAFMIGIFSLLDVLFDEPLASLLEPLHLADEVTAALLAGDGPLGRLLALVRYGEGGAAAPQGAALAELGLSPEDWAAALVGAARWAVLVSKEL